MLPKLFTANFIKQLENLQLKSKRQFLGFKQGSHASLKRGHGMEFADYRSYSRGDDPRHIDWKVFGRTDRMYVKQFKEEEDLSVCIILDSSASMHNPDEDRKWEHARNCALSLAYISLMKQDRVKISIPGHLETPFVQGAKGIHTLAGLIHQTPPINEEEPDVIFSKVANSLSFPGVAIVLSDFLFPLENITKLFNSLRAKNLDITGIQVLGKNDIKPFADSKNIRAIDSENQVEELIHLNTNFYKEYSEELNKHTDQVQNFCRKNQINFHIWDTNDSIIFLIKNKLTKTGLIR